MDTTPTATRPPARRFAGAGHGTGFWLVGVVFLLVMAYSTVPTPLYPLYEQQDGFGPATVTVVFAAYAVGVIVSLYLFGHLSDQVGRRPMLAAAVAVSAVSAVMFLCWPSTGGLIAARLVNGAAIGIMTATATAHLSELRALARPGESPSTAASVAGAINLGGLALGPLIGGLFAEFAADPLVSTHAVFLVLLVVGGAALAVVPETVTPPVVRQRYRPQRLSVPAGARSAFAAAGFGAFTGFAVLGLFTSLAPTFLVTTFHHRDHLLAGALTCAVFAAAAGQLVLGRLALRRQLQIAAMACTVGLLGVAGGALGAVIWLFVTGAVVAGVGVGVLFKAAVTTTITIADPGRRGESLALLFLIAYAGLAIPVLGVGAALVSTPPVQVLVWFVAVMLPASVSAAVLMLRRTARP